MKVLAIIEVAQGAPLERVRAELETELRGSWELFVAGILREAYATPSPARVVFVLEATDATAAAAHLGGLPLVAGGFLHVELVELQPFVNWSRLFAR